jgi:glucosamine-6-phosphate deaminase
MPAVHLRLFPTRRAMGEAAAAHAAAAIGQAVSARGSARIIVATGASQFNFLDALTTRTDVPWGKVEMFHLDEYVGLEASHPASFRRYLRERLIDRVSLRAVHLLDGQRDPAEVCRETGAVIRERPIDVAFVGIGENGHLAFNDPPADFEIDEPYIVVSLDEACRRQQVGEGWFPTVAAVPPTAISMTCRQILQSREILVIVPDARKAGAVQAAVEGPVTPDVPASILQGHEKTTLYLDPPAASRLARPPAVEG